MKVRIALYALATIVALIVIVISVALTLDFGRFKSNAEVFVSDLIQRDFRIDGPLHLTAGGTIELSAEGVSLASAEWTNNPTLVSIRRIEASIAAWSLVKGPLRIESLLVDGIRINMQENELGDNNWTFAGIAADVVDDEESSDRPTLPVLADNVSITDVVVVYENPQLARPLNIVIDRMGQNILESQDLELTIDGDINDTLVDIDVVAGKIESLARFSDVQFNIAGQVGEVHFDGSAAIEDLLNPRRPTATMHLVGPNIEYLTDILQMQRFTTGPLELELRIAPNNDKMELNLDGTFGEFVVVADGQFVNLTDMQGIDLQISANGPDAGRIASLAGIDGVPNDPFNIVGSLHRSGKLLRVEDFTITVGDTRVGVNAQFDQFPAPEGANMALHIEGPDIASFRRLIGVTGILSGPFGLDAKLAPDAVGGASVSFTGYVGDVKLSLEGDVTSEPGWVGSKSQIRYEIPNLRTVAAALDFENAPEIALRGNAAIDRVAGGFRIRNHELDIGADRLSFTGMVAGSPLQSGTDLQFETNIGDLKDLLAKFGVDAHAVPGGAFNATGQILTGGDRVAMRNIDVAYAGLSANFEADLAIASLLDDSEISFRIEGDTLAELLPVDGELYFLDRAFGVDGTVRLVPDAVQIPDLTFKTDQATLRADIQMGIESAATQIRARVEVDAPDIYALAPELAEISMVDDAPLKLRTEFDWNGERLSIGNFRTEIGKGRIDISGSIDRPPSFDATDLKVNVHLADLHNVSPIAGRELPHETVDFVVHLVGEGDTVTFEEFSGQIGDSDIRGDFAWTAGDTPEITLKLASNYMDLTSYFSPVEVAEQVGTGNKAAVAVDPNRKTIPDTPIPFDLLRGFVAGVDVRVSEMKLQQHIFKDIVIAGEIHEGSLSVSQFSMKNGDRGDLRGRLGISPGANGAQVWMRAFGDDLDIGLPAESQEELDGLPRYDMNLAFVASGSSQREMAGSVNGYFKLTSGAGRVRTGAMAMFTQDFLSQLLTTVNPFVKSDPYTNVKCAVILATVENGQIVGQPLLVAQSDRLNIFAAATIDLKSEKLNADINTVPMKGLGISLSNIVNPYVKVGGTLAAPILALDAESTLIQGGAAVATGGISILALGLKDRFFSDKNPCATAITNAEKEFARLEEQYSRNAQPQN